MIIIKLLKRPNKLSGKPLAPKGRSQWKKLGVLILNQGPYTLHVDSYTPKPRKKRRRKK